LVESGQNGWVVPAGKDYELAAAMEKALRCRAELAEMGRGAREAVERRCGAAPVSALQEWVHSLA
jgi:glycosyltransferase involved in cell wall biosynthesis